MINSKTLKEPENQPDHQLDFQAVDSMDPSSHHLAGEEKHDRMIDNIQKAFKVSRADFLAMTAGSHFNHQY